MNADTRERVIHAECDELIERGFTRDQAHQLVALHLLARVAEALEELADATEHVALATERLERDEILP